MSDESALANQTLKPVEPLVLFLDTEYTDPINIDLISLAMVSEDGRYEFYAERDDYSISDCNAFVRAAVLPLLDKALERKFARKEFGEKLTKWFATLPDSVVIACDDRTDYELLIDALDGVVPPNLTGQLDLRPMIQNRSFAEAVSRYHSSPNCEWHHALNDARAYRHGWQERHKPEESST